MNIKTAAPVAITVSLVVLMSGCAGAAAQGGSVKDDLSPAANAAAVLGLARGEVIVRDDLSPTRVQNRITAQQAPQAVPREFSADVRRELHSQGVAPQPARSLSADARRELHGSVGVVPNAAEAQGTRLSKYAEARSSVGHGVSTEVVEGIRSVKQAEARSGGMTPSEAQGARLQKMAEAQERQREFEVEHGASSDRLR